MKNLFYYLIILLNLFNINLINCDVENNWVNPLDMYEIFDYSEKKDRPVKSVNEKVIIKESNPFFKALESTPVCKKNDQISMHCLQLLVLLTSSIYSHIPLTYDYEEYEVNIPFLLSKTDMDFIRLQSANHISMNPSLCQLIQESLSRGLQKTLMNRVMDAFKYTGSVFINFLMEIKFQFRQLFHIEMQNFIILQFCLIFLSSVFIFFLFKSFRLIILWVLMCAVFLSVYTMYSHRYQQAVAKKEAKIALMGRKIPPECHHSSRTYINIITEYFMGNHHCQDFFKLVYVSPSIEIHMSDILTDIFSNFWSRWLSNIFYEAYSVSEKLTDGYPIIIKQVIQIVLLILCLFFFFMVISACIGMHVSMFGFHWRTRGVADAIPRNSHREFVEHVPTVQRINNEPNTSSIPSAEWFHNFLELQKKNIEDKILQDVNMIPNQPSTSYSKVSSRVHNVGIKRLKSVGLMVPESSREKNGDTSKRRGSF